MKISLQQKLSYLIYEARAIQLNFKDTLDDCKEVSSNLDTAIQELEDALYNLNGIIEDGDINSRENYKDYLAEENATTGRE